MVGVRASGFGFGSFFFSLCRQRFDCNYNLLLYNLESLIPLIPLIPFRPIRLARCRLPPEPEPNQNQNQNQPSPSSPLVWDRTAVEMPFLPIPLITLITLVPTATNHTIQSNTSNPTNPPSSVRSEAPTTRACLMYGCMDVWLHRCTILGRTLSSSLLAPGPWPLGALDPFLFLVLVLPCPVVVPVSGAASAHDPRSTPYGGGGERLMSCPCVKTNRPGDTWLGALTVRKVA